ncbi:MAG: LptA/OstA family protein [Bacillota bacterium]
MKNKLIIVLVLLLSFSINLSSLANSEENKQESKQEDNQATLTADRVRYKKNQNVRIANGNVVLDYQENHVTSEKLKMYSEDNLLVFTENVNLDRPDETIKSEKLQFDLDKDQLIAEKDVTFNTTNNDKKLYLTSDYLKLWTATDNMLAKDNVYMEYDGQKIRGDNLDYNSEEGKMIITDNAEIQENKEWIKSKRIVVDLKNDNIDAQGKVEMEFEF